MTTRARAVIVASAFAVALVVSGCSSSGDDSSTTSTTAAPKAPSAWVKKWNPTLVADYGPAQQAFVAAIQSAKVADVQTAAKKVVEANQALTSAIAEAGAPTRSDAPAATKLRLGLGTELALLQSILQTCTGTNEQCQAGVTAYAKNNSEQIIPALTALGAS